MNPTQYHPVEWFNINGVFKDIFKDDKNVHMINDNEAAYHDPDNLDSSDINRPTFKLVNGQVQVLKNNPQNISNGLTISKFTLITAIKFKGDFRGAESYVMYKLMNIEIPYVRVGTTYYKITNSKNRWGCEEQKLKTWKKEALTDDHTKHIIKLIPKYDDFIIVPDNKNYSRVHGNSYNMYSPFLHKPYDGHVSRSDIPYSIKVLTHIFGEQLELGLKYMKILYEHPKQMTRVIVLVSKEKGTGKTTFSNWLHILFGDNVTDVNPENLNSQFNSSYATKNILLFEELLVERAQGVEKIKALTTGKMITIRDLYISPFSIPFFGKMIFNTNKVKDFMRIDAKENRFWVRYVKPVNGELNVSIENDLFYEASKFLKYLEQLPPIDFKKDRLVFTDEETDTKELLDVKDESKSGLHKEIEILIDDFFNNSEHKQFEATAKDIKEEWFSKDSKISMSYIRKVLTQEMDCTVQKMKRYYPFNKKEIGREKVGTPFVFICKSDCKSSLLQDNDLILTDL